MKICIAAVGMAFAVLQASGGEFEANGCRAEWDGCSVVVKNTQFSRRYVHINGHLQTTSFKTSSGTEWQTEKFNDSGVEKLTVTAQKAKWSPVGVEGVRVDVCATSVTNTLFVFPGMPGVISTGSQRGATGAEHDLNRDIYRIREWSKALGSAVRQTDHISYGQRHVKVASVICADQTDIRDQLLHVDERFLMNYDSPFTVAATSLDCRDVLSGEGVVFVRIAPMPLARPGKEDDFIVDGSGLER